MDIILDTANIDEIKKVMDYFPIIGITTNPSILAKEAENLAETLRSLKNLIGDDLEIHVQTTEEKSDDIVREALELREYFGENFHCKLPMTKEGLKACRILTSKNVKTTVTTIFTPMQAMLAAEAGANYVAPYVNRLDNITGDGVDVVSAIVDIFENFDIQTRVLAASFKNVQQVYECARVGSHSATIGVEILETAINHPYTQKSLVDFESDWIKKYGNKKVVDFLDIK